MIDTEQLTSMFYTVLAVSGVKYVQEINTYIVFNNSGVLFTIKYNKYKSDYEIHRTQLLLKEYKKRNIDTNYIPTLSAVYNWVEFQHAVYQLFINNEKNIETIFHNLTPYTDIEFELKKGFETYVVYAQGQKLYKIGYDPKTKKHGFKRYEPMLAIYYAIDIPTTVKPNYPSLYKTIKDAYIAEAALENIQHIYDI